MGGKQPATVLGCYATRSRLHAMTTRAWNEPLHGTIASETARWDDFSTLLQRAVSEAIVPCSGSFQALVVMAWSRLLVA